MFLWTKWLQEFKLVPGPSGVGVGGQDRLCLRVSVSLHLGNPPDEGRQLCYF